MKVKATTPVRYKDQSYAIGQEFEIEKADYEQHKGILVVTEEDAGPEKALADKTVPELKEMAKEKGIEGYERMKKPELIAALEIVEAGANGGSVNPDNQTTEKTAGQE